MGVISIFLCIFVGCFSAVQSVTTEQDAPFPPDFPGFFENLRPFPFRRNFDLAPYDTIFSSWRNRAPNFHMFGELPPIMNIPKIEVFCNESELTVMVGKKTASVLLTTEEIQLGDGCHSNRELQNQFVFTYGLDECGTTRVMQNGLELFTNSIHLNPKKLPSSWWQTPSRVHISCAPRRSYASPRAVSTTNPHDGLVASFDIKAVNPSWTGAAESKIYKRGQVVNLQVSAKTRPEQQLFIQSCFVSTSPEPHTRPRHAVIINKGCTTPLGSPHAAVQFVASNRTDVVNFALNTSYLVSELYIHCSVFLSRQGVTPGSKSCNYNAIYSRWEEISGTTEVCECCSSKCKGLSVKYLPEEAKAVISTGPFVIDHVTIDQDVETHPKPSIFEPQVASWPPGANSMQSDDAAREDTIVSGSYLSRTKVSSPPHSVVVVSQDPVARLTLWLPGQVQDAEDGGFGSKSEDDLKVQEEESDIVSNDVPEKQPSTTDQETHLDTPKTEIGDQHLNVLTLANWGLPPDLKKAAIEEDSPIRTWLGRFGLFGIESPKEFDVPLPDEMTLHVLTQDDINQMKEGADAAANDGANEAGPVIRSKLQFSRGTDGLQTLTYEEEVVKQQAGEGVDSRCGLKKKWEPSKKGLRSTFLDLLRRMDRAE